MGADVEAKVENRSRSAAWSWLCWTSAGALLYVLSTGPVVRLEEEKLLSPGVSQGLGVVYKPLGWAVDKTPLGKPLGLYWHLWAPQRFDKNGKLVIHI